MAQPTEYIPGVCNIGPAEMRAKLFLGWSGLVIAVLFGVTTFIAPETSALRALVFFPIFLAALGFMQAGFHFCVTLGMQGLMNMDLISRTPQKIANAEYYVQDRSKAQLILLGAFLGSLILTVILVLV